MKVKFKDMGTTQNVVGVNVKQDQSGVTLNQTAYVNTKAEVHGLSISRPQNIPATPGSQLQPTVNGTSNKKYLAIVGSLMYAAIRSRPDSAYATCHAARYCHANGDTHLNYVKRILSYLNHTAKTSLKYEHGPTKLVAYVDADFGTSHDRKSTTGYVILYANGAICWRSRKQRVVTTSSAEAEYVALCEVTQEIKWIRGILSELGMPESGPTTVYEDNQSCMALANDRILNQRSKHIDIVHHFARERVARGEVAYHYVSTTSMIADALTKNLGAVKFQKLATDKIMR
jgi:hypothetical protein